MNTMNESTSVQSTETIENVHATPCTEYGLTPMQSSLSSTEHDCVQEVTPMESSLCTAYESTQKQLTLSNTSITDIEF